MALFNGTAMQLTITSAIIILGFLVSRFGSYVITKVQSKQKIVTLKQRALVRHFRYFVMIITITLALIYLKADIFNNLQFFTGFVIESSQILPDIMIIILVIILGFIVANLLNFIAGRFLDTAGITEFMIDQNREHTLNVILFFIRIVLYILIGIVILRIFNIELGGFFSAFGILIYIILGMMLLYIFFGTRAFVENFIAGLYIKSSRFFKLGQKIRIDENEGKIKSISNQGVTVSTDYGYELLIPNKEFARKEIAFKKIETDLDTLNKIKSYFVAQKPSYCGPASAVMILKIFGYDFTQTKIGDMCKTEVGKGTHPQVLIDAVEELTTEMVKGVWIDVNHIVDLKSELRLWLEQGALVIIDYKKNILFPDAKTAHYSVVVGVEGEEIVVLDPSGKKGGVYLADIEKVYRGMDTFSPLINGKRGYIVFAPEGTTAYHRLEEGIIYSDPSLYKDFTNKIKKELAKFTEKSEVLKNVLPPKVKNFIRKWKEKEKIARLWKPQKM